MNKGKQGRIHGSPCIGRLSRGSYELGRGSNELGRGSIELSRGSNDLSRDSKGGSHTKSESVTDRPTDGQSGL